MESFLGRYRNLIILVGVLFLQVLGLAVQVKTGANEEKDTRLIRVWALGAITPFERALVWVQNSTGNVWHNYFYLRGVRAENRQLKEQIEQMRLQQVRLSEDAAQARRLQTLLSFKEQFISKTVAAQVIGTSGSDLSRIVTIDKGENAGIQRDMAVITADGIVGKVLFVSPNLAQVLLISDQSSGVGAILDKSRLQGVLRGTANGEVVLERVMSDEQVQPGDIVLTSGGDQIFPKGLPVGTVTRVGSGKDLFLSIRIKPAANLSRLEEVLVLTEKQERESVADDHVRIRAADILAQRLPSVPDKPATDAASTGVAQGTPAGPAAGNSAAKAAGTAVGNAAAVKSVSGNTPAKSATVQVQPGKTVQAGKTVVQPSTQSSAQTSTAQKPKPLSKSSTEAKPDGAQSQPPAQPSIVEQKPAPVAAQPDTPPPSQDNSPQ
jgi:rod shape-determining protein MreC